MFTLTVCHGASANLSNCFGVGMYSLHYIAYLGLLPAEWVHLAIVFVYFLVAIQLDSIVIQALYTTDLA